jgi:hypothetical protein
MAYARFFRLLAALALVAVVGLSATWLLGDWFPTGDDEITHLQNASNVASELAEHPLRGLREAWMGRYAGEERTAYWPGAAYIATAPAAWLGGLRAPLLALLPTLLLLLWAVGTAANDLAVRLPQAAQLGSVAEVERRMGVGSKTSTMLQDASHAAAWRAVLLALLPTVTLLELRHYTPIPIVACLAAVSTTLLVLSQGFRHRGATLAWGLCVGLGLMSDRLSMAALVWAPLLVVLLQGGDRKRRLGNLGMGLALVLLLAGPFYYQWCGAWGAQLASQPSSDPMSVVAGVGEVALWIPTKGLGIAATGLLLLGLLGLLRRPTWNAGLLTWIAAAISPLPLLLLTEHGRGGPLLYLVAPLAVLAGVGWGRSRMHTSPAGTTLLALGSLVAMLGHAVSSGLLPMAAGPLTPTVDRQGEPRLETDRAALDWLETERGAAVLDLVQDRERWAGHWLHYLVSREAPQLAVDWPVRRSHAAYRPGRFVAEPCGFDHLLVIHFEDPWFLSSEVARPIEVMDIDEPAQGAWRDAVALARRCYRVDRVAQAPQGAQLTYLSRRDDVADLLAAQRARAAAAPPHGASVPTDSDGQAQPAPPAQAPQPPAEARPPDE